MYALAQQNYRLCSKSLEVKSWYQQAVL
jgi:hypothetical protein